MALQHDSLAAAVHLIHFNDASVVQPGPVRSARVSAPSAGPGSISPLWGERVANGNQPPAASVVSPLLGAPARR